MTFGRELLIALLALAGLWLPLRNRWLRPPSRLGLPSAPLDCAVPVEKAGMGVVCLTAAQATAQKLRPGDQLNETASEKKATGPPRRKRMAADRLAAWRAPVDVNRATADELASLDGIGPQLAARIVAARPFATIEEVGRVKGIGARRLARLRERLMLDE